MTKGVQRNLDVEASYDYGGRYPKRLLHNMLGVLGWRIRVWRKKPYSSFIVNAPKIHIVVGLSSLGSKVQCLGVSEELQNLFLVFRASSAKLNLQGCQTLEPQNLNPLRPNSEDPEASFD